MYNQTHPFPCEPKSPYKAFYGTELNSFLRQGTLRTDPSLFSQAQWSSGPFSTFCSSICLSLTLMSFGCLQFYALASQADLKLLESRAALPLFASCTCFSPRTETSPSLNVSQVLSHCFCHPSSPELLDAGS